MKSHKRINIVLNINIIVNERTSDIFQSVFYKDESTTVSGQSTVTTSVINLKLSPPTPSRQTETLHHHYHHHHHRPYRKVVG
ncbi:unnamed protein product, partial [Rotaria sordida]